MYIPLSIGAAPRKNKAEECKKPIDYIFLAILLLNLQVRLTFNKVQENQVRKCQFCSFSFFFFFFFSDTHTLLVLKNSSTLKFVRRKSSVQVDANRDKFQLSPIPAIWLKSSSGENFSWSAWTLIVTNFVNCEIVDNILSYLVLFLSW